MKLVIDYDVWQTVLDRDPDLIDEAGLLVLDGEIVINFRHGAAVITDDNDQPTHAVWSHTDITADTIEAVSYLVEQVLADERVERSEDSEGRKAARQRARRAARLVEVARADDDKTYRQQLTRAKNKVKGTIANGKPKDVTEFWEAEVARLEPLAQNERDEIRNARQAARTARRKQARTLFFAARGEARAAERQAYNQNRGEGEPPFSQLSDEEKEAVYTWPDWSEMDDEQREPWLTEAAKSVGHPGVTGE